MLVALLAMVAWAPPLAAESRLAEFLPKVDLGQVFPGADHLGPVEGTPPAAAAYAGQTLLGWVLLNTDVVTATGYSGKPIHVAVGVDAKGTIVGAKLLDHHEPIVLVGIPQKRIDDFIHGYVGYNVLEARTITKPPVDIVSGATVTVVVIGDSITRAAAKVVHARAGAPAAQAPAAAARTVDMTLQGTRSWEQLLGDGSIRRLHLSIGEINKAFEKDPRAAARPEAGDANDTFIDLYVAQADVPVIGRSLLGEQGYQELRQRLGDNRHAILVMGQGIYSFRGSGYVRGGLFDRIEMVQGENSIRFRDRDYERIGDLATQDAPNFPEIGLFTIPETVPFDPTQPWRLNLLVSRAVAALDKSFLTFELDYQLPEGYLAPAPKAAAPTAPPPTAGPASEEAATTALWQRMWRSKALSIGVLSIALLVLTAAFFFQDWLVRRPRVLKWFRLGYLAFTLLWLGWWANAQLSVVNILTLSNAVITGFSWDYFLMDPLLFILWSAVAASLLFWGRGAFCGWLCPFGALQEFVSLGAKRLGIRQINVPWGLHERLWPIKYVIFLGLFGTALYSLAWGEKLSEVEPFKTAIILKFVRDWPFVLFAVALLAAGLFIERFFCRYLCPLGAALAIPARIRMFDWLKRHRECGSPCQRCSIECPVQSIHPDGRINPNECIYCMHCQELYWDEHRCPHMVQVRLKREKRAAMSSPSPSPPAKSAADPVGHAERTGKQPGVP
ncbi:MAG: 4Fe-4S binding protein [Solirubrobacterales bacterium]